MDIFSPTILDDALITGSNTANLLRVSSPSAPSALFVSGSGNIGIGTTSPQGPLHIRGVSDFGVTPGIFLDSNGFDNNEPFDIRLASAGVGAPQARAIRIIASSSLSDPPGGAAISFYSNISVNFPGWVFIDSGANNGAKILFRTAPTNTGITERMVISSSGNVGIGTSTPTTTLNVNGTTFLQGGQTTVRGNTATSAATAFRVENSNATSLLTILNDGTSAFNTSHLYVSSSGRVGIGTTNPSNTLQVSGSLWATNITASSLPSSTQPNIIGYDTASGIFTYFSTSSFVGGSGTQNYITRWSGPNTITTSSIYESGSRIGIGIGAVLPNARLHISGANNEALLIASSSTAPSALFVSGSGRVGIGTSSPQSQLHIYTNQSPYIGLFSRVENTSGTTIVSASAIQTKIDTLNAASIIPHAYNINILNSSTGEGGITNLYGVHVNLLNSGSDNWAIYTSGSTKSYFGGKVGIGTTSPSARLHVTELNDTNHLLKVEGSTNTFIEVNNGNVLVSGSNVHLSGSLYFSASSAGNVSNSVLVRDNTTGQIKLTGSYGGGGGGGVTLPSNLLSGSGTPTYIALYSGSNFLSSSNIFQNSNSFIGINTNNPQTQLYVGGRFSAELLSSTKPQVVVFDTTTKELFYMDTSSLVAGGGGGTPGGINFDIQYNNNSAFGGTGAPQTFFYDYIRGAFGQGDGVSPSGSQSHAQGFYTIIEDGASYSHAEGSGSIVKTEGSAGHAEGQDTIVRGVAGHAEGYKTYVGIIDVSPWAKSGSYAHSEGYYTTASGQAAHSEGSFSWAAGDYSHAEGLNTRAYGDYSHAEGRNTATSASYAHSEGWGSIASASYSHAEGYFTITEGQFSHAEGNGTRTTSNAGSSHAEGASTTTDGAFSHAEGQGTTTYGSYSHAEGYNSTAWANHSHAEGNNTNARAEHSHTEGLQTETRGEHSHAEGYLTIASGSHSHAEGYLTIASGSNSHAEGEDTDANAVGSHSEGYLTKTNGVYSHSEGESTNTIGRASHSEGYLTTASGQYSHAEGESTQAIGYASHTIGVQTKAVGTASFAAGLGTVASGSYQNVIGKYNISSSAVTASFIIGNGFSDTNRSNLLFAFGSQVQITGSLLVSGSITATNISGNFLQDRIVSPVSAGVGQQTIAQVISGSSDGIIFNLIPSGVGSGSVIYSRYPLYTINGEPFDIGWGIGAPPSYSLDVYGESNFGGPNPYEGSRNNNNIRPKSYAFSHGQSNEVSGSHSFTQGKNLIASSSFQHVIGSYNQQLNKDYSFVIGNGRVDDRSNILVAFGGPSLITTPEVQITGSFSVTHNTNYNNSSPFADVRFRFLSQSTQPNIIGYDTASGRLTYFSTSSIAGSGGTSGTGTQNYITRWSSGTTITTSSIYESGSKIGIGIGAVLPNARLHISGANNEALLIVSSSTAPSALFVSGSGNVGIGMTTPSFRLDVSGSAKFGTGSVGFASGLGQIHAVDRTGAYITATQTTSSIVTFMGADSSGGIVGTYSSHDFVIRSNNGDKIVAEAGGNIGIQTTPAEWIHLSSDPASNLYLQIDAAQTSNPPPLTAMAPDTGYGITTNKYYLAEPNYWMEIKLNGTVVLIPCYTQAP